jgi:hypothetical protein
MPRCLAGPARIAYSTRLTPLGIYFYAAVFAIGGTTLLAARVAAES